ncbi:hypothetical protein [uncultured Shewanella sp.]|uniref:hypothetical protein n=1 Tax=uncultured Shewanella sp. TaxID=173975 RepID=UPI00262890D8|nr:hypothetical protein [uncultured Shewanella sp.]
MPIFGLAKGALKLATLAPNTQESLEVADCIVGAGAVGIGGYLAYQSFKSSANVDKEKQYIAPVDVVVVVTKEEEVLKYVHYFGQKQNFLKKMATTGYVKSAFEVAVKFGESVSKESFEKLSEASYYQQLKMYYKYRSNDEYAYTTDILSPKALKNILTFNYDTIESSSMRLIAKVLENLFLEYVAFYEYLAEGKAKKVDSGDYDKCYYDKNKRLWIFYDEELWKIGLITTHLVKVLTGSAINCRNHNVMTAGSFGKNEIIPITLYHCYFLLEFISQNYDKMIDDTKLQKRKDALKTRTDAAFEKLLSVKDGSAQTQYLRKMVDKVQIEQNNVKIYDSELTNLENIKALQLINKYLAARRNENKSIASRFFDPYGDDANVNSFTEEFKEAKKNIRESYDAHQKSLKAIQEMKDMASQADVFVDRKSISNLFGALSSNRQRIVDDYYQLYDFQGHLKMLRNCIIAANNFARNSLQSEQIGISLNDESLEYLLKNIPFLLSKIIFPTYPAIDRSVFITTQRSAYFQKMFSASFEYLLKDKQNISEDTMDTFSNKCKKIKETKINIKLSSNKVVFSLDGADKERLKVIDDLSIDVENNKVINATCEVGNLLSKLHKAPENNDDNLFSLLVKLIRNNTILMEATIGFLREIEATTLALDPKVESNDVKNYRQIYNSGLITFVNRFIFDINEQKIDEQKNINQAMFSLSYPEQLPFIEHMFRTRLGVSENLARFGRYHVMVHWQLAHSMLFFSTHDTYKTSLSKRKPVEANNTIIERLGGTLEKRKQDNAIALLNPGNNVVLQAMLDEILTLHNDEEDERFLISLSVAFIMKDYDVLLELYLVQQSLRQLSGVYGESFTLSTSFKKEYDKYEDILSKTREAFKQNALSLAKSIEFWKQELKNAKKQQKAHTNSYQASRDLLKLSIKLDMYHNLVEGVKNQLPNAGTTFKKQELVNASLKGIFDKENAFDMYAPQLEGSHDLIEYYDEDSVKTQAAMTAVQFQTFFEAMTPYLGNTINILESIRINKDGTPNAISLMIEDSVTKRLEPTTTTTLGQGGSPFKYKNTATVSTAGKLDTDEDRMEDIKKRANDLRLSPSVVNFVSLANPTIGSVFTNKLSFEELLPHFIEKKTIIELKKSLNQLMQLLLKKANGFDDKGLNKYLTQTLQENVEVEGLTPETNNNGELTKAGREFLKNRKNSGIITKKEYEYCLLTCQPESKFSISRYIAYIIEIAKKYQEYGKSIAKVPDNQARQESEAQKQERARLAKKAVDTILGSSAPEAIFIALNQIINQLFDIYANSAIGLHYTLEQGNNIALPSKSQSQAKDKALKWCTHIFNRLDIKINVTDDNKPKYISGNSSLSVYKPEKLLPPETLFGNVLTGTSSTQEELVDKMFHGEIIGQVKKLLQTTQELYLKEINFLSVLKVEYTVSSESVITTSKFKYTGQYTRRVPLVFDYQENVINNLTQKDYPKLYKLSGYLSMEDEVNAPEDSMLRVNRKYRLVTGKARIDLDYPAMKFRSFGGIRTRYLERYLTYTRGDNRQDIDRAHKKYEKEEDASENSTPTDILSTLKEEERKLVITWHIDNLYKLGREQFILLSAFQKLEKPNNFNRYIEQYKQGGRSALYLTTEHLSLVTKQESRNVNKAECYDNPTFVENEGNGGNDAPPPAYNPNAGEVDNNDL